MMLGDPWSLQGVAAPKARHALCRHMPMKAARHKRQWTSTASCKQHAEHRVEHAGRSDVWLCALHEEATNTVRQKAILYALPTTESSLEGQSV